MLLPKVRAQAGARPPEQRENRRLGDALFPNPRPRRAATASADEADASSTPRSPSSEREVLRKADFDTMSADEWRAARRALR